MKFKVAWIWIGWRHLKFWGSILRVRIQVDSRYKMSSSRAGSSYKVPVKCSREGLISGHQEHI